MVCEKDTSRDSKKCFGLFRFPILSDQELAALLDRNNPEFEFESPKLEFPKLSKSQQQFGVNPAYQPPLPADLAEKTSTSGKPWAGMHTKQVDCKRRV